MKKFKTVTEAGEALRIAAEKEQEEVAAEIELQKQIKSGLITPSGKKIIRFGEIKNNSSKN